MIFKRLVENLPKIPKNATIKFNQADNKTRKEIIWRILLAYNKSGLTNDKNIINATYKSAVLFGLNPETNIFLQFLDKYNTPISYNESQLFPIVVDIMKSNVVDINNEYLVDKRLFKLKPNEFNYTFNLFNMLNDTNKLKKFFKDPTVVRVEELFIDNDITKDLKPVGIGKIDDESTIFGTVEKWSSKNEPFDVKDIDFEEDYYIQTYEACKETLESDLGYFKIGDELFQGQELQIGDIAYAKSSKNSTRGSFYYLSENGWKKFSNSITKRILSEKEKEENNKDVS